MTIKFPKIKELGPSGKIDAIWLKYHQKVFEKSPDALRRDYDNLVRTIKMLHEIETALRTQVLHNSMDETSDFQDWFRESIPSLAGSLLNTLLKKI